MKRMIIATALAGLSTAALAETMEIKGVEISGYLDMSLSATTSDKTPTDTSYGLDAANIKFAGDLSEDVYVEARLNGSGDQNNVLNTVELEQANVVYTGIDNVSIIAGKYLSALGWEAFHAPNLYQYSYSATLLYPGMMNGAGAKYSTDSFSIYGALLAGVWDTYDKDGSRGGAEGAFRFTGVEDLTVLEGAATESYPGYQQSLLNIWASYVVADVLLAAEINAVSDWFGPDNEGFGWLFMANYMFTEKFGLTGRTSGLMIEDGAGADVNDDIKFTIAPNYALTDNLSFVAEYNVLNDGVSDDTFHTVAFEAIVTF